MTMERPTDLERVLVDATALLLERTRRELERDRDRSGSREAAADLARIRDVEERLTKLRDGMTDDGRVATAGRQVSRYYEASGQEDN